MTKDKPASGPEKPYRPCVGICLFHADGRVFVGERLDNPGAWQMPQGGIDPGEDLETAALRELKEEIGTDAAELLRVHDRKIRYKIPDGLLRRLNLWDGKYAGQEQTWVAMRFTGTDADIDLTADERPEFSRWKWLDLDHTLEVIVPFKRATYRQVIAAFRDLA